MAKVNERWSEELRIQNSSLLGKWQNWMQDGRRNSGSKTHPFGERWQKWMKDGRRNWGSKIHPFWGSDKSECKMVGGTEDSKFILLGGSGKSEWKMVGASEDSKLILTHKKRGINSLEGNSIKVVNEWGDKGGGKQRMLQRMLQSSDTFRSSNVGNTRNVVDVTGYHWCLFIVLWRLKNAWNWTFFWKTISLKISDAISLFLFAMSKH